MILSEGDYQLRFVQPNFTTPEVFALDTTITSSPFSITMNPGQYQWELKAQNFSH